LIGSLPPFTILTSACNDGDSAARMIQEALGIESDQVANYVFPKSWPADREQRARIIGEWLTDRGAVSGLVMHFTPFFQFALLLVIPGALLILLTALLWTGRQ
jgi:hypothetical protein